MLNDEQTRDLGLIKKAFEKIAPYEAAWLEYERMYKSVHTQAFLDAAAEQDRNAIFIPLTYSTVNIADSVFTTSFFSQGNPIEILNLGDSDKVKRDALKVVVDYFYNASKPYQELSKSFMSALMFGLGVVKIYWDDEEDMPQTDMIPVTSVAFDYEAISRKDIKYTCHRFSQTLSDINDRVKSGFYSLDAYAKEQLLNNLKEAPFERKVITEIYTKKGKGWFVRTFCEDICLREKPFKKNPLKHGYMLDRLPSIDTATRENEIAAIGDSLVRIIKPLNEELNIKRNQRMDLIEKHINPEIYIPESCGLDASDALRVGGIKSVDSSAGILFAPVTGATEFSQDVAMLKNDIEDASSINGIMRGSTSASDRRSASALATVNANSSPRLEGMVKLICETLFEEWARDFVRACYINASDELVAKLTENDGFPLGQKGARLELDLDIKINFGVSINKQAKIQDLISIVQMVGNNPNADVNGLIKEIIKLSLGENVNAEAILGVPNLPTDADPLGADGGEGQALVQSELGVENGGGGGELEQNQGNPLSAEIDRIRSNQI